MHRLMRSSPCVLAAALLFGAASTSGQILLVEDFDDGVADGFTPLSGAWEVVGGEYLAHIEGPGVYGRCAAGEESWQNYQFECDLKIFGSINHVLRFRVSSSGSGYELNIRAEPYFDAYLYKWIDGNRYEIAWLPFHHNESEVWHRFEIQALVDHLVVRMDEELLFDLVDTNEAILNGGIELIVFSGGVIQWQDAYYDNVLVTALTTAVADGAWSGVKALY